VQNYKNKFRKENINEENYKILEFLYITSSHLHTFICVIRIEKQWVGMNFFDEDGRCVQIPRFGFE